MRGSGEFRQWMVAPTALALAFLSGCVGAPSDSTAVVAGEQDPTSPYIPLAVGADESAIDGVVLTDAFEPLEGARVELREREGDAAASPSRGGGFASSSGDRATASDRLGRFAFLGLEPGSYGLVASHEGFTPAFTSVETTAGQVASVKLFLAPLALDAPYFEPPLEVKGFIGCGIGVSPVNPSSCTNGVNEDENHRVHFTLPVDANLTGILFEMVWTARGQFAGENLQARLVEPASASFDIAGPSPLTIAAEAMNQTYTAEPQNLTFDVRVAPGTHPLQGGDWRDAGGVVVGQPFTVYLTLFYRGHAVPEGFTALPEA